MELDSTASLSIADENYRFPKGTNVTGLDRIIKSRKREIFRNESYFDRI
jgi:hypothetical protein